jgi:DNA-binding phage protein
MLTPEHNQTYPKMTADERAAMELAIAEESAGKVANIAAAAPVVARLEAERAGLVTLVAQLKSGRQAAGVSLSEMETRTGIQKSALSRLENSKAPNPTLLTLQRYAKAIGMTLDVSVKETAT